MKNILLIVLVVIAVVFGGLYGWTLMDKSKMAKEHSQQLAAHKKTIKDKAAEVESHHAKAKAAQAEAEKSKKELKELKQEQMAAAKGELASRDDKIAQLGNTNKELQSKLASLNKQVETLQEELEGKDKQVANFKQIIEGKDTRIAGLNKDVTGWQAKERTASTLAEKYKNRLLENKIPVEPEKKFAGHILTMHKEPDFLILDIGIDDDMPVGQELKVIRDNHFVGKITVQKLLPENAKLSTAVVLSLVDEGNPVRVGDVVKN